MTDYTELERLAKAIGEVPTSLTDDVRHRVSEGCLDRIAELFLSELSQSKEREERLADSVEGLTEDLYQAVLVAYRRGAEEWARLNYPQWIDALKAGREVCPPDARSVCMSGANEQ